MNAEHTRTEGHAWSGTERTLLAASADGIACLTLNRPGSLNSINEPMVGALNAALDSVEADRSAKVLLIAATGRAFCAGADLKESAMRDGGPDAVEIAEVFHRSISTLFTRIENFPLPVIAAVNGLAVAGGLELILCCDLVIADEHARFADGHVRYGLVPGAGSSVRLPRKIGPNRANEMLLAGREYSASTMREWGLVNEIAREGESRSAAFAMAAQLARTGRDTLVRLKQLSRDGAKLDRDAALENEQLVCREHHTSDDRLTGIQAFLKRK